MIKQITNFDSIIMSSKLNTMAKEGRRRKSKEIARDSGKTKLRGRRCRGVLGHSHR